MLQCIYRQPNPFEKFVYDSLVRKKSYFESEFIVCHHTLMPKVWIVADLYSQLDPPLLSAHTLRKNYTRRDKFVADIMQQVDVNTSHYKYILKSCHIRRTSRARQRNAIEGKLRELRSWQQLESPLKSGDKEWIDNTLAMEYSKSKHEKKVYLGFTPYFYNEITNCKEKLAATIFSHAIYDSSEFLLTTPGFGPISGGSKHILKMAAEFKAAKPYTTILRLTDEEKSWQIDIIAHIQCDVIHFVAPPYTGAWNFDDGNRLINIKVLDVIEGLPKAAFKFVYI